MKWYKFFPQAIIFYGLFILIGLAYTGKVKRQYAIVPADSTLVIGQAPRLAKDWAAIYRPELLALSTDLPVACKWEAVNTEDQCTFVYRYEWPNETRPVWWQHGPMQIFRLIYHHLSWKDSEWVEVTVDKSSGLITRIKMPSAHPEKPTERCIAQMSLTQGTATLVEYLRDGQLVSTEIRPTSFSAPFLLVADHWDHLFRWQTTPQATDQAYQNVRPPLELLTNEAYEQEKYCRREAPTYHTPEPASNLPIILFVGGIFLFYFSWLRTGVHYKYVQGAGDMEKNAQPYHEDPTIFLKERWQGKQQDHKNLPSNK